MAQRTLEDIDGVWPEPGFKSGVVARVYRARKKPLDELTAEDLRTLISQKVGLPHVMPLAVELLEREPLAGGDLYPGDLIVCVVQATDFLAHRSDMFAR